MLRGDEFYAQRHIDLRLGTKAQSIDRPAHRVLLDDGSTLPYAHLVLATGARARPLHVPGADLDGVAILRNLHDATRLRANLETARRIVVIGAGFIGLEFAAVAAGMGREVVIVEIAPRVMARAVSPVISRAFEEKHRSLGSTFLFGAGVAAIEGERGRATGVRLADGREIKADLVVIGVGVLADDGLARDAGLAVDNGIVVDGFLRTSDELISAIGDSASFPDPQSGRRIRLESVQNALDQGRCVARRIVGKPAPYSAVPWFWSDQADLKLQIAGYAPHIDEYVTRGDLASNHFSVFGLCAGKVAVVETVNRAGDHMAARRFLPDDPPSREEAMNESYDLKAHAMRSARRAPVAG